MAAARRGTSSSSGGGHRPTAPPPSPNRHGPRALVIGAGPSGLVAAKYLLSSSSDSSECSRHPPLPSFSSVTILESSHTIGGTFVNKAYDGTRLVSSKYITAFSDFRMDDGGGDEGVVERCPDHPSAEQYVAYLSRYCTEFDLWGHIKFGCEVISVADATATDDDVDGDGDGEDGAAVDGGGYTVQYHRRSISAEEEESQGRAQSHNNDDGGESSSSEPVVTEHYDHVLICSGLHNVPQIPPLPNLSSFRGTVLHSSLYQSSDIFANKRVLILGSGETAMDVAHRAVTHPTSRDVALNVRRGFLSIPHTLPGGRPLDVFITNLFEHSYEHPWVHTLRLRWVLSTVIIRLFLALTGSSVGFNQWTCHVDPVRRGYHIINKSAGAMPHLNVPVKTRTMWGRLWLWAYGEENLKPIQSFHGTSVRCVDDNGVTVRFDDGRAFDADVIVLATGYRQEFPFLSGAIRTEMREQSFVGGRGEGEGEGKDESFRRRGQGRGYALEEDHLPSEHFIVSRTRPKLGFIGFIRPNVGAIPPMSELQVMWWLCNLQGKVKRPEHHPNNTCTPPRRRLPSYMVLGRKYQYGVDYGNYMHRVAEDIDSAPTLTSLLSRRSSSSSRSQRSWSCRWKALYVYTQGQAHVPLFRLRGPFASDRCWQVVTDELWAVCLDRGWLENVGLGLVTWLSLWMNLCACLVECVWGLVTLRRPRFFARYG